MSTVHTEYGPGRIIASETVRGRRTYKVAGEGFEIWLDEAKLGGYEPPADIDLNAPHWEGYDLGDKLTEDAFGGGPEYPLGEGYERPGFGLEDVDEYQRYLKHHDYLGGDDDPDSRYASRSHLGWAPLDDDNSTELPYNPDPQHDAIGDYGGDDQSSTIQPIHHIDADERTRPADSLSFEEGDGDDEPGPNPDLFAKHAFGPYAVSPGAQQLVKDHLLPDDLHTLHDMAVGGGIGVGAASGVSAGINTVSHQIDSVLDMVSPGPGWGGLVHDASRREANPAMSVLAPLAVETLGQGLMYNAPQMLQKGTDAVHNAVEKVEDQFEPGPGWGHLVHDAAVYRPAGLSDRYIDITAGADYHNDPVAQFRHDPDAYINRVGHLLDEGLNPRFAEYMDLVEGDSSVRTAAWKDVRAKAVRLKTTGKVHVKDLAPTRIMASVEGDHGTYDVAILKGAMVGDQSIANWHCGCEWGKWAFRRKFTYVGRLCSHAYASYLTMQSAAAKSQPRQKRGPSDMVIVKRNPRDRQYPMPVFAAGLRTAGADPREVYLKLLDMGYSEQEAKDHATAHLVDGVPLRRKADALQNGPQRLTPEMVVNDTDDAQMFLDVTKDERTDTGPDDVVSEKDIVHFAKIMRLCEAHQRPYPRTLVAFLARYADCADDASDDTQDDYQASDADDANRYLDRLRSDADRSQEDDLGSMAERVRQIQDTVEEARAHGADASRFVAMLKTAVPGVGNDNIVNSDGTSRVQGWGASPDTAGQFWQTVGESYINPEDMKPGSAVRNQLDKENPQGTERRNKEYGDGKPKSAPSGSSDPDAYKNLNGVPGKTQQPSSAVPAPQNNGGQATPAAAAPVTQQSGGSAAQSSGSDKGSGGSGGNTGGGQGGGNQGGGGQGGGAQTYTAPGGGQTSGTVTDGGVAGAENGNNAAITKNMLDADGNYTVQKGDTWTDIAQRTTGDMNNYQKMYDLNKGVAGPNIDSLAEGTKINLKDFANDKGNNGLSGDVTNPAGGGADGNPATVDTPKASGDSPAVGDAAVSGVNAGTSIGVDTDVAAGKAPATPTPPAGGATDTSAVPKVDTPAASPDSSATGTQTGTAGTTLTNEQLTNPGLTGAPPNQGRSAAARRTAKEWLRWAAEGDSGGGDSSTDTSSEGTGDQAAPATNPATTDASPQPPRTNGTGGMNPGMDTSTGMSNPATQDFGNLAQSVGDIASGVGGAVGQFLPGVGGAISGIGSGISGLMNAFGGGRQAATIFGSKEDFDDWVRYAYPQVEGEGKLEPHTHPFAGSGYPGPLEIGTSEEYADKARKKRDDVTDLGDIPLSTTMGDWQKQSRLAGHWLPDHYGPPADNADREGPIDRSYDPHAGRSDVDSYYDENRDDEDDFGGTVVLGSTDDDSDIVRTFQAHLGETALGAGAGGGAGRFDDFAGAAQGFLRTAGRNYSLAEQDALIREGDKGGARNLDSLDLAGTHYEDMTTLGW